MVIRGQRKSDSGDWVECTPGTVIRVCVRGQQCEGKYIYENESWIPKTTERERVKNRLGVCVYVWFVGYCTRAQEQKLTHPRKESAHSI